MDEQAKFEFCSIEWVDAARRVVTTQLAERDLTGVEYSFTEEFSDPPAQLRTNDAESIGWHFRIHDGQVDVQPWPLAEATMRIVMDYGIAAALAKVSFAGNADAVAAARETMAAAAAEGKYRLERSGAAVPSVVRDLDLHDTLAPLTA